jgi:2-iminoacetate synthase
MAFNNIFHQYNWDDVKESIRNKTSHDVEMALTNRHRSPEDFKALISHAAMPYLEDMAQLSRQLTQKRFGKTIQMYAPLYLSNVCSNFCVYCGFNSGNKIKRKILTPAEISLEIAEIKRQGFNHILLVTGEAKQTVHVDYFKKAIDIIKPHFANISIEVQPLEEDEYRELNQYGVYAVLVYQETYREATYPAYHPKGKKTDFEYRLETPDRAGRAGSHKIGLGILLGLEDWRTDSFFCALHLDYLQKMYWQTKYSISFPRIRPAQGTFAPNVNVTDRDLVQLICAYRLLNENVELSISTRESEQFRNNIIKLGVTSMSAGSKTNPGGYAVDTESLEQFAISDERSAHQVAEFISGINYEPVWKDWDKTLV